MQALIGAAGLVALGAITPGPNNLIVMRQAARAGYRSALPAAAGVLTGGLALLVAVSAGMSTLVTLNPGVRLGMSLGSWLLLTAAGLRVIAGASRSRAQPGEAPRAMRLAGFAGLFVFQFLNPKAWLMVVAIVSSSASTSDPLPSLPGLGVIFAVIPAISLALWSVLGSLATPHLARPVVRAWFDRLTGGVLIGFGLLLLTGGLDAR